MGFPVAGSHGVGDCWASLPHGMCGSVWASWVYAAVQFSLLCFCTRQSLAWRWKEELHLGAGPAVHRHRLQTWVHQGSRMVLSGQRPATSTYARMLV